MKKHGPSKGAGAASVIDVKMNWSGDYLFDQYPDGVLIVGQGGKIIDVNETFLAMTNYEKSDLLDKKMEILMPGAQRKAHVRKRAIYARKPKKRPLDAGIEPEVRRKDGTTFPADLMLSPLQTEHGMLTVTLIRDISARRQMEKNEREVKETLNAIFNSAPVALFCLDSNKKVLSWSSEAERLFGYSSEEIIGGPHRIIPPCDDKHNQCNSLIDRVFTGESIKDLTRKRLHKDGSLLDVSISASPMYDNEGNIYAAAYSAQDISERFAAEEKLNRLAYFDELTGLPNGARLQRDMFPHFDENEALAQRPVSLAILELGGFREASDTLGRSSGENLLKQVARRLTDIVAGRAEIYVTGGFEFSAIKPECDDPRVIMAIVDDMIAQLRVPFEVGGQMVHLTAKAGVSVAPLHGQSVEELLANTSLALSAAKGDNIHDTRFFSMSIRTGAQASRDLDIDLRRAFENDEFELYFQPQVDLVTGKTVGAEALLRWCHFEHGVIPPGCFIEALGKNPIAYDVGKWIMRTAIEKTAAWRKAGLGDVRIGVNLFAAQFEHDIVKDVEDALADFALPANMLELEITENIALGCDRSIIEPLRAIKNMGIGVAFDDFGTGYASLSYLVKYPLTRIKIDKGFLENIPQSSEEKAIVKSIITMSHGLGLEVIAEGVESHEHAKFLLKEHCEEVQGFLYAKPLPEADFMDYLRSKGGKQRPLSIKLVS